MKGFKDWFNDDEHDLYNYPEEAMENAWNEAIKQSREWIDNKKEYPEAVRGNKVLGFNGEYVFECEFDGEDWCSVKGDQFTHWMPLPEPPCNA